MKPHKPKPPHTLSPEELQKFFDAGEQINQSDLQAVLEIRERIWQLRQELAGRVSKVNELSKVTFKRTFDTLSGHEGAEHRAMRRDPGEVVGVG